MTTPHQSNDGQCHYSKHGEEPKCQEPATTRIGGVPLCKQHGDRSGMKPVKPLKSPCDCGYAHIGHMMLCPGIQWDEDHFDDPAPEPINWQARAEAKFPDIGKDPLKLIGEERQAYNTEEAMLGRLHAPCAKQQNEVPDQTALVWRADLSWILGQFAWRQAGHKSAMASNDKLKAELSAITARAEKAEAELKAVEQLISDSQLHRVQCGGMNVGMHRQPLVIRLRPINEKQVIENRTKELRESAARARKWHEELSASQAEVTSLRAIFPKILDALENGAGCSPDCSIEFMQEIPREVELVIKGHKAEACRLREALEGVIGSYKRNEGKGVGVGWYIKAKNALKTPSPEEKGGEA